MGVYAVNGADMSIKSIFKGIVDKLAIWASRGEVVVGGRRTDVVCCCVLFGFHGDSSLFLNLLPAFPNSEISHKNQGFWLLLKKTEDLAIVALDSLVATRQPELDSECPRHSA